MKTRQEHNLEICQKLTEFFSDPNHKDIRFFQALNAMDMFTNRVDDFGVVHGINDPFHTESKTTNDTIDKFLNK